MESLVFQMYETYSFHFIVSRLTPQQPHVSNCTKLLEGLGLGLNSSLAARSRPPPPGFAPAPNHMNAFGLGIPRAAPTTSNTSSNLGKLHLSNLHLLKQYSYCC